jgi:hypothetical protein
LNWCKKLKFEWIWVEIVDHRVHGSSCSWWWIVLGIALGMDSMTVGSYRLIPSWEESCSSMASIISITKALPWAYGYVRNLVIIKLFLGMDSPWHCLGTEKVGKLLQIHHSFRFFNHIRRQTRYNWCKKLIFEWIWEEIVDRHVHGDG